MLGYLAPVANSAAAPNLGEHAACFKCQRETVVKAVLPIGPIVYLRCEACGAVWSIAERRDPLKMRLPPPTTPTSGEGI